MKTFVQKMYFGLLVLLFMGYTSSNAQSLASYAGTWENVDANTRGVVKVIIAVSGSTVTMHPYGACQPNPCDWGTLPATAYSSDVSTPPSVKTKALLAEYNPGFAKTTIEAELNGDILALEIFDKFTDGSGRNNYNTTYKFRRSVVPTTPDLVISAVTNFRFVNNNTQVEYTYTIKNLGSATTKAGALQGSWSKDGVLSSDDMPSGGVTVGAIGANQAVTGKFTMNVPNPAFYPNFKGWTLPQMLKTYPYLILVIDNNKEVTESNENNNTFSIKHGL